VDIDDATKVMILLKPLEHGQPDYRHMNTLSQTLFAWIGSVRLRGGTI
jgi:hypothetical protein